VNSAPDRLEKLLATVPSALKQILDSDVPLAPGKWSKKQLLGHLIDSASNNHQRFVRAQVVDNLQFPGYEQDPWVAVQSYATESWEEMVILWEALNRHLLHIMRGIPDERLSRTCAVGGKEPMTLPALMDFYLTHVEHHLEQILESR
jgi:hypothetical protein